MTKFKVGDRVRVIKSLDNLRHMVDKIGQTMTVERVYVGQEDWYNLVEDSAKFLWENEELELVERPLTPELQLFKDEYVNNNFAIRVETQQAYNEVIDKLDKLGYTWVDGNALKDISTRIMVGSLFLNTRTHLRSNEKSVIWSKYPYGNTVYKTYKPFERIVRDDTYTYNEVHSKLLKMHERIMKQGNYRMEKNNMNTIHFIDTIAFNKKTFKTTIVLKYGSDRYETVEVVSNKKDFLDFRVGFLLTWLKAHLTGSEFKTLIGQLFFKGKPQITFLRGYALRYFNSLRQMDKFLEAIKDEKDSVNIGGNIIELVWKGNLNE